MNGNLFCRVQSTDANGLSSGNSAGFQKFPNRINVICRKPVSGFGKKKSGSLAFLPSVSSRLKSMHGPFIF